MSLIRKSVSAAGFSAADALISDLHQLPCVTVETFSLLVNQDIRSSPHSSVSITCCLLLFLVLLLLLGSSAAFTLLDSMNALLDLRERLYWLKINLRFD